MYLVFSTSLSENSRSRILAEHAARCLELLPVDFQLIDLAQTRLPACDAGGCYSDPNTIAVGQAISNAHGILIAAPIYNYCVSANAKNLIELTGRAWTEKVVGFMCAAGGNGSFMSILGLANCLMLDFRSLILPRFVFATGDAFDGYSITDPEVNRRISELVDQLIKVSEAMRGGGGDPG